MPYGFNDDKSKYQLELHKVATSGLYSDLDGKPTFKTVNHEEITGEGDISVGADVDNTTIVKNNDVLSVGALPYQTTLPTSDNTDGTLKIVTYTDQRYEWEPSPVATKYNGYLYLVDTILKDHSLTSFTWAEIQAIAQSGQASTYFKLGEKTSVEIDGVSYEVRIIDFNHYGSNEIDFQLVNCLTTLYPMNSTSTNTGGWASSVMKSTTMGTIFNQLPSDLQAVIGETTIPYIATYNSATISQSSGNKLFLASEYEIFGVKSRAAGIEGTQFTWYSQYDASNNRTKKQGDTGSAIQWWLRSPGSSSGSYFCYVSSDNMTIQANVATNSYGVSPVFVVK